MACKSLATTTARYFSLSSRNSRTLISGTRCLSTTQRRNADEPARPTVLGTAAGQQSRLQQATSSETPLSSVKSALPPRPPASAPPQFAASILSSISSSLGGRPTSQFGSRLQSLAGSYGDQDRVDRRFGDDEYHLHVYSHKHNTHLTLSNHERKSIISISAGNLGFRKGQRGSYDAGFQLMAYMLSRMQQQGLMAKIQKLELVLRGFGQGREAVTKVLLGVEGTRLREQIVRVVDKTRLKIGGTRSPAPRRLG